MKYVDSLNDFLNMAGRIFNGVLREMRGCDRSHPGYQALATKTLLLARCATALPFKPGNRKSHYRHGSLWRSAWAASLTLGRNSARRSHRTVPTTCLTFVKVHHCDRPALAAAGLKPEDVLARQGL
jgi:hypothetical protein